MPGLIIVKSIILRVFLVVHGLICAWRVVETSENSYAWVILVGLIFLILEGIVLIGFRHGRECPNVAFCIIFYLTCAAPSLWIIHLDAANKKLFRLAEQKLNFTEENSFHNSVLKTSTPLVLSIRRIDCRDKGWRYTEEQHWLDAIQESMFVVLSGVRLLISFDHFTAEQSGIILIVGFLNSADLLSISQALQYHDVIIERFWMYIGLILLTVGLFQFAFVDTDGFLIQQQTKRYRSRKILLSDRQLTPLIRSLFFTDGLLLIYRVFLAIRIRCNKPSIFFFVSKNLLSMISHLYRVYNSTIVKEIRRSYDDSTYSISSPSLNHGRYQFYGFEEERRKNRRRRSFRTKKSKLNRTEKLLHRTIRRYPAMIGRRKIQTPQSIYQSSTISITYPFARRRNDGGRSRTAFAFYGLPFPTPQAPRPATISSRSSRLEKTFIF